MPKKRSVKRGPKAERLKLQGTFKGAAKKLLAVKRPAAGWPKRGRAAVAVSEEE